jgi:hypothetical protein
MIFKTLNPEEVETEVGLESTDITGGDPILCYCPETPGDYLQMTSGFRARVDLV